MKDDATDNSSTDRWVVTWEPPINKGTVACLFDDHSKAVEFLEKRLIATGWPMNPKLLRVARDLADFHIPASAATVGTVAAEIPMTQAQSDALSGVTPEMLGHAAPDGCADLVRIPAELERAYVRLFNAAKALDTGLRGVATIITLDRAVAHVEHLLQGIASARKEEP